MTMNAAVNVTNVLVLDNPAPFLSPFRFQIEFECFSPLENKLEWKLIYVGSAGDDEQDQQLESVLVGPVDIGNFSFVLEANPPDPTKINDKDIIGPTLLFLTGSYLSKEFVRIAYYVNNDYEDEEMKKEPPTDLLIDKIQRDIQSDSPRVTKFPINFYPTDDDAQEQLAGSPHHSSDEDH